MDAKDSKDARIPGDSRDLHSAYFIVIDKKSSSRCFLPHRGNLKKTLLIDLLAYLHHKRFDVFLSFT
jgi:hypothetical protein